MKTVCVVLAALATHGVAAWRDKETVLTAGGHELAVGGRAAKMVQPVLFSKGDAILVTATPVTDKTYNPRFVVASYLFEDSQGSDSVPIAGGHCLKHSSGATKATRPLTIWARYRKEAQPQVYAPASGDAHETLLAAGYVVDAPSVCYTPSGNFEWVTWENNIPINCPFPRSRDLVKWEYLNGSAGHYGGADTWYPSWGEDDMLYTPWTDGSVGSISAGSGSNLKPPFKSSTGYAVVGESDPFNLDLKIVSTFAHQSTWPYYGRYPCGSLSYNGMWYYGTYYLHHPNVTMRFPDNTTVDVGPNPGPNCDNWCVQGPFSSLRYSSDRGTSWTEPRKNATGLFDNIFRESAFHNGAVRFGAPHFVDFGKNNEGSPDGYAYIVGHGVTNPKNIHAWMLGDQVFLARVKISEGPVAVNNPDYWSFYAGRSGGEAFWVEGDANKAQPLVTWERQMGVVTVTYHPTIKKYIMAVSTATPDVYPSMINTFDTYFLEADSLTSKWSIFQYNTRFGPSAYFVNHPSKFMAASLSPNGTYDGFLSYSANFMNRSSPGIPLGSGYHWSLQQMRITPSQEYAARLRSL